ncbi:MAG: mannose-phosphate guanylyltransferase / mannose-6-phosphate isomerase [Abditibacteriota bacterium]|nr:mannose-phosphate guanylyltransferase / mannose-6-phosphate isomerase [Abditibacteriota bacterium]
MTTSSSSSLSQSNTSLSATAPLSAVILTGGTGSRLWPLSRAALPKQMLPLTSERSMLQETILRLQGLPNLSAPILVSNHDHRFLVAEQLREINIAPQCLMLEPIGRNTAPAVAVAALNLLAGSPDALMLVLPADHVIADVEAFHAAIAVARGVAQQGHLVTFGIVPQIPETGYGYIQRKATPLQESAPQSTSNGASSNSAVSDSAAHWVYEVARFVEKPNLAAAQEYVAAGDYLWNSGMFLFRAQDYLQELERVAPEILAACRAAYEGAYQDLDFLRLDESAFFSCPSQSIDYAVMEKTDKAVVVPVEIGWNDVGSWAALWDFHDKDEQGNVARGEVLTHNTRNCYLSSERRLLAAVGVEDLIVVETADAVLVAHKDAAQDVKKIVEQLQQSGRCEHETHRKVYRPWGSYEGVDRGERFQVKRIIVNSGATLSMQMHHHRAEHWVVVSGTALVTLGQEEKLVTENESIYIPLGTFHRLHNPGRIPLHLIEVQSGPYLDEDDILRTDDVYNRQPKSA